MKRIIIHIHDFGLLKNIDIQLAPFMIFTGQSNLGKSYANYLVYYFLDALMNSTSLSVDLFESKVKGTDGEFTVNADDFIQHLNKGVEPFVRNFLDDQTLKCDAEFEISDLNEVFPLNVSFTKIEGKELESASDHVHVKINETEADTISGTLTPFFISAFCQIYISNKLMGNSYFRELIFPPANGSLVNADEALRMAVTTNKKNMYSRYLIDNNFCSTPLFSQSKENDKLYEKLLGGELLVEKNKEYLKLKDREEPLSLSAAASSIKEISPLFLLLKNRGGQNHAVCLEEPEAHLHPSLQLEVANIIAISVMKGDIFHITTHSDYMLQRFNQLIKLGEIKKKDENEFNEFYKGKTLKPYLDCQLVKAYYFHKGEDKVIVDDLPINEGGIPLKTFFDTISKLRNDDNKIDDILYGLSKDEKK